MSQPSRAILAASHFEIQLGIKHGDEKILNRIGLLNACGLRGGGGSSNSPAQTTPAQNNLTSAPAEAAYNSYFSTAESATLHAQDSSGNQYTLKLGQTAPAASTFNGVSAMMSTRSLEVDVNGTFVSNAISDIYFNLNPFEELGSVINNGSPYLFYPTPIMLPSTVNVGDNGALGTGTIYHDSTKNIVDADETLTYSVSAYSPSAVLLCLDTQISNVTSQGVTDGLTSGIIAGSTCYQMTSSGTASLSSFTVDVNGTVLDFQ